MVLDTSGPYVGEINFINCNYEWVVTQFCVNCKQVGDVLKSPIFSIQGSTTYRWQIALYPRSELEVNKNYISLFLRSCNTSDISASFELSILNNKKEIIISHRKGFVTFTQDKSWGQTNFIEGSFILDGRNGMLRNDELTILCEINIREIPKEIEESNTQLHTSASKDLNNRIKEFDSFEKLLNNNAFSDITLQVSEKEFHVHKVILANRSPVFEAMLNHDMKEKQEGIIQIKDVSFEVFQEVLRFMYTGRVDQIEKIANELLIAADKYDVEGLKAMCEETLCKSLNIDNVLEYLKFSDLYKANILQAESIKFIVSHAKEITQKPGFKLEGSIDSNVICQVIRAFTSQLGK